MRLYYAIFILLFIHISSYCFYEGRASQSFCSGRKVDYDEVSNEYKSYYSQYRCCYIALNIGGEIVQGCFTTSPSFSQDFPDCFSNSNYNHNPYEDDDDYDDDDDDISVLLSDNKLKINIYKLIILSLLILY